MKNLIAVVWMLTGASHLNAQNITDLNNYKFVTVQPAATNTAVPRFEKLNPDIEAGIRHLLLHNKIPILNNRQEAADKGVNNCEILTCVYYLSFTPGMMYNAIISYSLHFTDCNEKEVLVLSGKKSVGIAIGADGYVKLFEGLMKPYSKYVYGYKGGK